MWLAVDIGGTKTLLAVFDKKGIVVEELKFPTPQDYDEFLEMFERQYELLKTRHFQAGCVAVPGRLDRDLGKLVSLGNLPWENEWIVRDLERITNCPIVIENDAKLAGLSEAILVIKKFKRTLYVTISTGIGTSLITNGVIDHGMQDMEGGQMMLVHRGKVKKWESFASGKAISKKYGMRASDINDPEIWKDISRDFAIGFIDLIAVIQPDAIIIGGGVGSHFKKYGDMLIAELKKYETPIVPIPPILPAKRPEEAVVYGCFELVKATYGHTVKAA